MATAKQAKSPSPAAPTSAVAALSLDTPAPAVPDDELEAFRREWRAEVSKKREVEVDAGGVLWKGTEREGEEGKSKVVKEKGKDIVEGKGKSAEEVWPEPLRSPTSPRAMPTSPTKMARPRSPVKNGTGTRDRARSPVKPPGPKSPTKASFMASSPTKSTAPIASKRFPPSTPYASPAAASRPAHPGPTSAPTIARTDSPAPSESDSDTMPFPQRKRGGDAIALYTRAVEAEQAGKLSDALHLYRRAFRADDNVDRLYALNVRKAEAERARLAPAPTTKVDREGEVMTEGPSPTDIVDPQAPELPEYKFTREVQVRPDYEREVGRVSRLTALLERRVGVIDNDEPKPTSPSSKALDSEKQDLDPAASFRPSDPAHPLPLSLLPAELLDRILSYLDVIGVERFALTCWRARLLTAQCGLWKRLAEKIYAPPMVPEASMAKVLARRHRDEWRTTLVEEERLRMDGAYIAVCHYVRPGAGEQWVTITHMITYHRFLRFYPDGHVISFLTTDHPSDVVPNLKPTLRAKGLHFGRWVLVCSEDERGKKRPRVLVTDLLEPGTAKYEFEMELALRETGRGRWNKLDLVNYSSINLATGESLGLSLRHQKPFYFSKVRSYNPPF